MRREEVIQRLAETRDALAPFHVEALFLFGSVARGDTTAQSDVDLLVDFDETPSLCEFARLGRVLADVLGTPVDLVSRSALKAQLRDRILSEAIRVARG
jgi:predicted nucleotidyltransferase